MLAIIIGMTTKRAIRRRIQKAALLLSPISLLALSGSTRAQTFDSGNIVVSRSVYQNTGDAANLQIGSNLPDSKDGKTPYKAVADGSYPNVFSNAKSDPSFSVSSAIFLDQLTISGSYINTYAIPTSQIVTSFPSKSELGLNLSTNGTSLTFMGYTAPAGRLDVSNSFTPGSSETGNFVTTTPTYRAVYQLNADGSHSITQTQAYSGNNGRNAILDNANNQYLTVGNAGNGSGDGTIPNDNGVQSVTPGQNPVTAGTTPVGSYSITQNGYPADKQTKDNNFRGETIFNNTLYVTKGSGGNGINTVYQVGAAGTLPTGTGNAINILPGFSTTLAKSTTGTVFHPFGLFFANASTLYVADEGNQSLSDTAGNNVNAGLQKWSFSSGSWNLAYTLQTGLGLGLQYTVSDPNSANTYTAATDGLRNLTGKVNTDGTVTLFGITSTVSNGGDQGADPNRLVAISDILLNTSEAVGAGESFSTLGSAKYGEVLRGVSFAPNAPAVPEASQMAGLGIGLIGLAGLALRKGRAAKNLARAS